jgi:hypothetical protein
MSRLAVAAVAVLGLTAGVAAAELAVGPAAIPVSALPALGAFGIASLAIVVLVSFRRGPVLHKGKDSQGADVARRRIRELAAKGQRPDAIARETGLPRDVIVMALHATGGIPVIASASAGSAGKRGQSALGNKVLLRA